MDMQQLRYFVTAARCLNFTKAADQLFVTQPALSRQITSIEKELNIQLFIRDGHSLKLTPAAKMLLDEFAEIFDRYEFAVERANAVQHGVTGTLTIGVLDGMRVDDIFPGLLTEFTKNYPEVELVLRYKNLNELIYGLYDGSLDLSFTLRFEVENRKYLSYKVLAGSRDHVAVHRGNPLAQKDFAAFSELENETFILVSANVSETSAALILDRFKKAGFRPNTIYSPSLYTSALFVQAGLGVTMFDSRSIFRSIPGIKFLDTDQVSDPSLVAAWHQSNSNAAFVTFQKTLARAGEAR
ncbi:MAG: LysR family transcriptional regulator [Clostridiales Family XIII bacterium]|jgi:DNA-binding transcriptional LysR family regulator|nr:LysR family transcriptional regulator [Clostridiales Family XIII bacterium]